MAPSALGHVHRRLLLSADQPSLVQARSSALRHGLHPKLPPLVHEQVVITGGLGFLGALLTQWLALSNAATVCSLGTSGHQQGTHLLLAARTAHGAAAASTIGAIPVAFAGCLRVVLSDLGAAEGSAGLLHARLQVRLCFHHCCWSPMVSAVHPDFFAKVASLWSLHL